MRALAGSLDGVLADLRISFTPPFPTWLMVWVILPAILAAMLFTFLLYFEQRQMAPRRRVLTLTFLRLSLLFLLLVLLFQPGLRRDYTRTSNGTLWLLVDQSPSMQTRDPQASDGERLHWAEGLGLLSERKDPADALQAQVHAMADEFVALIPSAGDSFSGGDERPAARALADRLAAWAQDLGKLRERVEAARGQLNALPNRPGDGAASALQTAQDTADSNASDIRRATTMGDALRVLNQIQIARALTDAERALAGAAAAEDAADLGAKRGDPGLAAASGRVGNITRDELAWGVLAGADARGSKVMDELAQKYHLRVASFAEKTQSAGMVDPGGLPDALRSALLPTGSATNLTAALQYVAEQISVDEAASVVVISDGRNNIPGDPTGPARNLAARGVRVYGLLVGSHESSPDAAVQPVDFPDWVYQGDTIKARALVRLDGLQGRDATATLKRGNVELERHQFHASSNHETIPFDFTDSPPESEKAVEYEIEVSQMPGEVNTQNNRAGFRVAVKKDKIYVLVVEDRPRWEYRYLASFLARRPGLKVQTVLLQPALVPGISQPPPVAATPDNPRDEAQILPATQEGWQKFDLIILGDIGPDVLTPQYQQFIAAAVRDKGTTLITIAGQKAMPALFANSPLAEILPVSLNPQWTSEQITRHTRSGFEPISGPLASGSVLAQFDPEASANAQVWSNMPLWFWHSPFTEAKPATSVFWTVLENNPRGVAGGGDVAGTLSDAYRHALLSSMTIGLGHSLYLASDQTWRMRQVGGANMHDRFWGQVLNWAVGSDLPAGGKYVRFGANQPVYEQTQPVVITARVLHEDLTPYTGLAFSALARAVHGTPGTAGGGASAGAGGVEAGFQPMESPGYYQATLTGLPIGDVEVSLKGQEVERLLAIDPSVTLRTLIIKIMPTMNKERENMNTDPALLETVARAGGGFSVDAQYADVLLSRMPKIEHTETTSLQIGFFADPDAPGTRWAHWGFLGVFTALLTLEWALRKRAGLV